MFFPVDVEYDSVNQKLTVLSVLIVETNPNTSTYTFGKRPVFDEIEAYVL